MVSLQAGPSSPRIPDSVQFKLTTRDGPDSSTREVGPSDVDRLFQA